MTPETPDFTKVERYDNWCALSHGHAMMPRDNGNWVRRADYESLRLAHEQVTQEISELKGTVERQSEAIVIAVQRMMKAEADLAALRAAVREWIDVADRLKASGFDKNSVGHAFIRAQFALIWEKVRSLLQPDTETP